MLKFIRENWLIILSAIYIVSPFDIIPDFIVGMGLTDDIAVVAGNILVKLIQSKRNTKSKQ